MLSSADRTVVLPFRCLVGALQAMLTMLRAVPVTAGGTDERPMRKRSQASHQPFWPILVGSGNLCTRLGYHGLYETRAYSSGG